MTLSVSTQVSPVGSKLVVETSGSSAANNAATGASGNIYQVEIDNTSNSDNAAFLKIYDVASPVVGTTAPDMIFKVPVNQTRSFVIPSGLAFSYLSFAVVVSGGTAGTTSPTNPVIVRIVTS